MSWRRWIELMLVSQSLASLYSILPPLFSPAGGLGVWTRQEQGQEQEQVARPEQQLQVPFLLA